MSRYYPAVRQPGCPDEFDEDDEYTWTYDEARAFAHDRDEELEVMLPLIDDPDLIDLIREYLEEHYPESLKKAMNTSYICIITFEGTYTIFVILVQAYVYQQMHFKIL